MKLPAEFVRLPLAFDADRLAAEVAAIDEAHWVAHPQGFRGNSALLLVSADGDPRNDSLKGHMAETPVLRQCEYLRQVLASFGSELGRTRLMRIDEHEEVTPHCDVHYYWREHLRIHVPIVTDPSVEFVCGDRSLHMGAGECWVFDTWKVHCVRNPSSRRRVHLVADTRGSPQLWKLLRASLSGAMDVHTVAWQPGAVPELRTEGASMPVVMPPVELADHVEFLLGELRQAGGGDAAAALGARLKRLRQQWQGLWLRFAATEEGWPHYRALLDRTAAEVATLPETLRLANGTAVREAITQWLLKAALNPELARGPGYRVSLSQRRLPSPPPLPAPVFIVAAPRSGSTLLFETLSRSSSAWTVGGESHQLIEGLEMDGRLPLSPAAHGWESNRLEAADAMPAVAERLRCRLAERLRDHAGQAWTEDAGAVRLLEKTPKNALRIPFLAAAFPDARFVYLVREPMANVSSILEAWRSGEFVTYEKLPDWKGGRWSLLLIPGWRDLEGRSLAEVAVAQYQAAHEAILADLAALPRDRWQAIGYEDLLADPEAEIARLSEFLDFEWTTPPPMALPPSAVTLAAPAPTKWLRNADAIAGHRPQLEALKARICRFTGLSIPEPVTATAVPPQAAPDPVAVVQSATPATTTHAAPAAGTAPAAAAAPAPAVGTAPANPLDQNALAQARALASVHTRSFTQVLTTAGISLAVSTYQAGKLVLLRADGDVVNTNFKEMRKPMGIALDGPRLAVGTANEVQVWHDVPAVAPNLEPRGRVDAAWLPRSIHFTGNIDIHEMAYAGGELWAVNTRFCCLCTFDAHNSFVPRWKPPFLSALAPEDRCHLNGLGVRDGRVRYVTMLGRTDTPGGWRENKSSGGLLMDLDGERVIRDGLSMPHSPRWYRDQLWVLESGTGGLCRVDPETGATETLVELPGFTRGLDFYGPLAFIGLSQVRESAVFSRLPITERLTERICGVWVVNIEQRQVVGFLRFEQAVQEIFAVTVLPRARFPELVLPGDATVANAFVLPDEALRQVPPQRRAAGG